MNAYIKYFRLIPLAALALTLAGASRPAAAQGSPLPKQTPVSGESWSAIRQLTGKPFTDPKGLFQLTFPADWKQVGDGWQNQDGSQKFCVTYAEIDESLIHRWGEAAKDFKTGRNVKVEPYRMDGHMAYYLTAINREDKNFYHRVVFSIKGNRGVVLSFGDARGNEAEFETTVDKICLSFRWK